ncbi:MAG: hypothetical protein JO356_04070 [Acidobacteria bacterium]|nr:hypothetical protein [Acidobacteriota bacterium]
MKEDVKKKKFLLSPQGDLLLVTYIQPRLLPGGVSVLGAALHRRAVQRRSQPQVILLT